MGSQSVKPKLGKYTFCFIVAHAQECLRARRSDKLKKRKNASMQQKATCMYEIGREILRE